MSTASPPPPGDAGPPAGAGRRLSQLARIEVHELRGVGARKASALAQMGICSVLDLVLHYPRRYADRTNSAPIADALPGEEAVISARVERVRLRRPRGRPPIVELVVADDSGRLTVTFFNQPWRARQLEGEANVVLFGKVDLYRGAPAMTNPIVDLVGDQTGRIVPIYPQSQKAGIGSNELAGYLVEALERAGQFADPLAEAERVSLGLIGRTEAFSAIHAPETMPARFAARRRLAFDELWRLQVALVMRKRAALADSRGIAHRVEAGEEGDLVGRFLAALPFTLTEAQRRVIAEIASDLASPFPMHRLLQGDVGAGKTVVALAALLYAVQGGHQGALMVPTEVLAEQHFLATRRLLEGLVVGDAARLTSERPVAVELLTSRTPAAERKRLLASLAAGGTDLLVGTHALITEDVSFSSLGVVVIDEQHRFGVDQRAALREKGSLARDGGHDPDLLVMTATPIPRTAAMTVYGDLDYSVLDELPRGRTPVRTSWVEEPAAEQHVWEVVRAELEKGHQAYVVCPLVRPGKIEEDEEVDEGGPGELGEEGEGRFSFALSEGNDAARRPPRSTVEERARLSAGELCGAKVGLLHGQLAAREKEKAMAAFRDGELDVLVATTVVEVGVDVTNATVMVIEDADRFGIAQLHQLRGRVGRGKERAWCFLLASEVTPEAAKRLGALEGSTDGFELAEIDLELRGEGTVLGARQKGRNDLRLASLRRDRDLVLTARASAEALIEADPTLANNPLLVDELKLFVGEEEAGYLLRS